MNETNLYKPDESGCLTEEGTKSYYSRIGLFCFLLGTISTLVSILAALIVQLFFPWILNIPMASAILEYAISFIGIYCLAMPVALLALSPLPTSRPIKEKMKISHLIAALCVCFTFMQVGSSFSSIIISFVESLSGKTLVNPVDASLDSGSIILSALCVGILFPILEEILFRRLLCHKLLPLGEKKAIIISALIFGFIHGNLYQFAYAFLLGLIFGYIYVKTGKLIYTIVFHCIINLFSGVFVQYILTKMPLEKLEEILNTILEDPTIINNTDKLWELISPYALGITLYMIYSYTLLGLSFAGFIILFVLTFKRKITFEQGILQTPKKHRISNFFLNGGIAAAIGYIALSFLASMMI